jgi:hypothetical protein
MGVPEGAGLSASADAMRPTHCQPVRVVRDSVTATMLARTAYDQNLVLAT